MTWYINIEHYGPFEPEGSRRETVSEYEKRSEAIKDLPDWRMAHPSVKRIWVSARCCASWREPRLGQQENREDYTGA